MSTFVLAKALLFGAFQGVFAYYAAVGLWSLTDARAIVPDWIFHIISDVLVIFSDDPQVVYTWTRAMLQLQILQLILTSLAVLSVCEAILAIDMVVTGARCGTHPHAANANDRQLRVWTAICALQLPGALYMPAIAIIGVCGELQARQTVGTAMLLCFFGAVPIMLLVVSSLIGSCQRRTKCHRDTRYDEADSPTAPAYNTIQSATHDYPGAECDAKVAHYLPCDAAMPPPPPYSAFHQHPPAVAPPEYAALQTVAPPQECGVCGELGARARVTCTTCNRVVCQDCCSDQRVLTCWPCVAETAEAFAH